MNSTSKCSDMVAEVVATISEGLMLVSPQGRIEMVNPALERLTGYSAAELIGQPCTILGCEACHEARKGAIGWCRLFERDTDSHKRCEIVRKDGVRVPVSKNARVVRKDGTIAGAVETFTDLSEVVERDRRIEALSRMLDSGAGFAGMVGSSQAMQRVFRIVERAAESDAPVLILGPSGSGKELVARAVHDLGPRQRGPFVPLNCSALNDALLESELFGHAKGSFSGAIRDRQGRFEAAHGGDLFLDEIGDLPPSIQVKLLRVLETKHIERVGENQSREVDVRIICATHRDLWSMVRMGAFREDLLYRINVIPVVLPALQERKEDIPLLATHFAAGIRQRTGKDIEGFTPEAMRSLTVYSWPGNVRELRSAVEYAFVLADSGRLGIAHLPQHIGYGTSTDCGPQGMVADAAVIDGAERGKQKGGSRGHGGRIIEYGGGAQDHSNVALTYQVPAVDESREGGSPASSKAQKFFSAGEEHIGVRTGETKTVGGDYGALQRHDAEVERDELVQALRVAGGNMTQAARILGVHRGTVRNRMLKHGIDLKKEIAARGWQLE
ncbi:sigma-54 interaction domain-containing protein [Oleidesulfovibrio sp.]|uniref:sigma-54 interaction domain-containing protein n=1 Tax=Oleidesulfovibrio sp. TaxID=2909707 RepID=UPI003A85077A